MTSGERNQKRHAHADLRRAGREATAGCLDARGRYERVRAGGQQPTAVAKAFVFAGHRRVALAPHVEHCTGAFDACARLRAARTSPR